MRNLILTLPLFLICTQVSADQLQTCKAMLASGTEGAFKSYCEGYVQGFQAGFFGSAGGSAGANGYGTGLVIQPRQIGTGVTPLTSGEEAPFTYGNRLVRVLLGEGGMDTLSSGTWENIKIEDLLLTPDNPTWAQFSDGLNAGTTEWLQPEAANQFSIKSPQLGNSVDALGWATSNGIALDGDAARSLSEIMKIADPSASELYISPSALNQLNSLIQR